MHQLGLVSYLSVCFVEVWLAFFVRLLSLFMYCLIALGSVFSVPSQEIG